MNEFVISVDKLLIDFRWSFVLTDLKVNVGSSGKPSYSISLFTRNLHENF